MKPALGIFVFAVFAGLLPAQTLFLNDSNNDVLYTVDPNTGAATMVGSTLPVATPAGMAHDGTTLYTLDLGSGGGATGGLYSIDPMTGTPTLIGPTGLTGWQDIAWDPTTNQFFAVNQNDTLYTISTTGTATLVGATPAVHLFTAIAVDSSGVLWGIDFSGGGAIGMLDKSTAAFTITAMSSIAGIQGMSFHPTTGVLYATSTTTDSLYTIDPMTGTTTLVGPHGGTPAVGFAKSLVWELTSGPSVPASATSVGAGCPGVTGVPVLTTVGSGLPMLGNASFALQLLNGAPNSTSLWFIASSAQQGALQIAPNCFVHLEPTSFFSFLTLGVNPLLTLPTNAAGETVVPVPIPNDPGLNGATVGVQVAILDPSTALGFSTTNALNLVLGS